MRKFSNMTKTASALAIAGVMSVGTLAMTSAPAAAQIHAGVGIGPLGVGVNLGDRDRDHDGYWREGYWHRDRDYAAPARYYYDGAYPYGYYGYDGYSCTDPYSPYYDTAFCD